MKRIGRSPSFSASKLKDLQLIEILRYLSSLLIDDHPHACRLSTSGYELRQSASPDMSTKEAMERASCAQQERLTTKSEPLNIDYCHVKKLPNEILLQIADDCGFKGRLNLASTDHYSAGVLRPGLFVCVSFRSATVPLERDAVDKALECCSRSCASEIKRLTIDFGRKSLQRISMSSNIANADQWSNLLHVIRRLEELSISTRVQRYSSGEPNIINSSREVNLLLQAASQVVSLHVDLQKSKAVLTEIMTGPKWLNLSQLKLEVMEVSGTQLAPALLKLRRKLKALELKELRLSYWTWDRIFKKIADDCSLDDFTFISFGLGSGAGGGPQQTLQDVKNAFGDTTSLNGYQETTRGFIVQWKRQRKSSPIT